MGRILITGGAGFVGSNLAVALARAGHSVVCLDNLSRRGSEILLGRIQAAGCQFVHGDIRSPEDFSKLTGHFDLLIECSADPSVVTGTQPDGAYFVLNNNLTGAINCFEYARKNQIPVILLSTSRVYPFNRLNALPFVERATRLELDGCPPGVSEKGIRLDFPLDGVRSLYGASKLSAELILQEYAYQFDLPAIINRFGVIAGPWQMGKADQGIFTYWMVSHFYGRPLKYIGYGGTGKQVRDLLHVDDLVRLIVNQMGKIEAYRGEVFNAGGSTFANLSLLEATGLCQEITGKQVAIGSVPETRAADIPWYITDNGATEGTFDWRPEKSPREIFLDTYHWLVEHHHQFDYLFGGNP